LIFLFLFFLFLWFLPGRESNPGCWDRIPASYHSTTLTPLLPRSFYILAKCQNCLFENLTLGCLQFQSLIYPNKNISNFARFHLESAKRHQKTGAFWHFSDQNGQNLSFFWIWSRLIVFFNNVPSMKSISLAFDIVFYILSNCFCYKQIG